MTDTPKAPLHAQTVAPSHATSSATARVHNSAQHVSTTQHRACDGVRLFVWKQDRSGYTTVVGHNDWLDRLLPLVGGDLGALSKIARAVSQRITRRPGSTWTQSVLDSTERLLTAQHTAAVADTERAQAQAAAENNAAWE